jgi:cell division protein FtsZ
MDISGATGALVHITGGTNLTLKKVNKVMQRVQSFMDPHADVIFGARVDEKFEGSIRLMAVVTGIAELSDEGPGIELADEIDGLAIKYTT